MCSKTWDISTDLTYLFNKKLDQDSLLKSVTLKMSCFLHYLALVDLPKLNISAHKSTTEGCSFLPTILSKQSRKGKFMKEFFLPRFEANPDLCPVHDLELYMSKPRS